MKKILFCAALLLAAFSTASAIELKSEGRDPEYVASIVARSKKIVDKLALESAATAEEVTKIVANRYFELNDIYEARDKGLAELKAHADLPEEYRTLAKNYVNYECDSKLYRSHFAFPATLGMYLTKEQVTQVIDGMTYGVVGVTYKAQTDMIPSLTDEEKAQILAWLEEARELAVDAESSNKKHGVFGKYKGRINNYLSKRGYDLKAEREGWYKRIEAEKATKAAQK